GSSNNYSNGYFVSDNTAVTFCPTATQNGDRAQVSFSSFNIEPEFDALYIFNGNSTSSPLFSSGNPVNPFPDGGWWGTALPPTFVSTHPSGCLTFKFHSDGNVNFSGWQSLVTFLHCIEETNPVVCANSTGNVYSAPSGMSAYSWSVSGNGTMVGSSTGSSVTVTAGTPGTFTTMVTVTDANGGTSTCSKTVTVNALTNASITTSENSGTPNDGTICAGASVSLTATGGGTYAWSTGLTTAAITVFPGTTTTYTVTVTAVGGCTATASQTITVNPVPSCPVTGPDIVCPNSAGNVYSAPAGMSAYSWSVSGNGTMVGSGTGSSVTVTAGAPGTFTAMVTVTDANGCTSSCSKTLTVNVLASASISVSENSGTPNDGIVCAGTSVSLTASGGGTYEWSTSATTATITVAPTATTTYTVTVTDANGCTASATQTIQVNTPPTCSVTGPDSVCPNSAGNVYSAPAGMSAYAWSVSGNGTMVGSGTGSSVTVTAGASGTFTATVIVTGANGCTGSCSKTVTAGDNVAPGINCPASSTVSCAGDVPAVNLAAVSASDNCSTPVKSHVSDATTGMTCTNRKTVTRTYRATDASGNSSTCAQVITVFDDVKPVFTSVPANVTVQCNSVPAVGTATASDGCSGSVTVAYNGQASAPGSCPDAYTITRQWTATDACGNTKTATQRITVIDNQKPNFTGTPANVTVQCNAVPGPATPTATDNCDTSVAITYVGQTNTAGTCPNAYTLTRTWVAADNCGNTRTVTQRITVVDNTKPVFTALPADASISCTETPPAAGTPTASDGCGGSVTVTYLGQTSVSGTCPVSYQLKRTWRATDACGNSTSATQTIQVSDGGAPVFTSVPAATTVSCTQPLPPLTNPTATDACGYANVTFLGNVASGSGCSADYTVTRTWRATDLCGNSVTCTQVITVQGTSYGEQGTENRAADDKQLIAHRSSLIVNPNPTTDRVWVDLSVFADQAVTVSLFGDLGQLVWERRLAVVEELKLTVSLREAGAAVGVYTLCVRSASGVATRRVVLVE
ncbi:MAG: hypothetical protein ABMA02_17915, partial [Saprospiraceae bacterium]